MTSTFPDAATRGPHHRLSVAPMMARTDRHYRYFMRQITRRTLLYTEMVTTGAILHGDRERLLGFSPEEHPLALQVGGSEPADLRRCARIAEDMGYDEINLNVGCPSDRVQSGRFGACLMAEPERVADAVAAMRAEVRVPVTVKHRIGIDHLDRYEDMLHFVTTVSRAGCDRFSVHARKAWLDGLSPKDNRTIPPLRYEDVWRLKRELPHLWVEINGGVRSLGEAAQHLDRVDAVMIGRAAYDDPWLFAAADASLLDAASDPAASRVEVALAMLPYIARWQARGEPLHRITRHMLNLFAREPGTRAWKRVLSSAPRDPDGVELIRAGLESVARAARGRDDALTASASSLGAP